jgi:hypothetical protein
VNAKPELEPNLAKVKINSMADRTPITWLRKTSLNRLRQK